MEKNRKLISNWGNFPIIEAHEKISDSIEEIKNFVKESRQIIARGSGRCYGDASLGDYIFSTRKLNKFLSFDSDNGILECESGVLLSDILEFGIPKGYFLSVTPGTRFITIGGAIASDVHGKNHHSEGAFSTCLLSFSLVTENGEEKTCSRKENPDKFWATLGGMGLTGIIISAKIRLKKIETAYIKQESIKAYSLDEIFRLFDESENWTYTVAWIDCLQRGKDIGRSILQRGEFAKKADLPYDLAKQPLKIKKKLSPTIPFYFPEFVLNKFSIKVFNYLYFAKQRQKVLKNILDYESFFYPLDVIKSWNKIYGKKGFIQYQMVIPKNKGKEGMRRILETIANSGNGSFLAVLKLFGKSDPKAYNSFPMEGYTLALDFKVNDRLPILVEKLDAIVEEFSGRIYRTKDSMSKSSLTNYLENVDSEKFISHQQKRILSRE
ncbi:MAG: FAD-binding oxidoreductase [Bergeyella sp.]|nr:FAD-binding oxidoreductase [Bergeyella sp.]